jgi:beta-mannanase
VHDLFVAAGATNVTWVWSPVIEYPGWTPLAELYPGAAYVDWVAMDGYNSGTNPIQPDRWRSFSELFGPTYSDLGKLAPGKPIMIAETASTEDGGSKATWITDALRSLPRRFRRVAAFVWFNSGSDGMDWPIGSSTSARKAFAAAIRSPYFAANDFGEIEESPIRPIS